MNFKSSGGTPKEFRDILRSNFYSAKIAATDHREKFWTCTRTHAVNRDYFMVGECVRFLFTSCEGSLNERVSAANE